MSLESSTTSVYISYGEGGSRGPGHAAEWKRLNLEGFRDGGGPGGRKQDRRVNSGVVNLQISTSTLA